MGRIMLIASGKGGVGKTTLAVNTAVVLASLGHKVILVDMNVGMRNDDIYLGLEDQILFDFGDVSAGMCKLEKAIVKHDMCSSLDLLCCPQNKGIDGLTTGHIRALYARLRREYDFVIVDMPTIGGEKFPYLATGADESILVVNQDYVSIRNGDAINRKLAAMGIAKRYYVVNKVFEQSFSQAGLPDMMFIDKSIEAECLGFIPMDFSIHLANNNGMPVVFEDSLSAAKIIKAVVMRLL